MEIQRQHNLEKLILSCKGELLNHTLQDEVVSPYIKNLNGLLDECLVELQKGGADQPATKVIKRPRLSADKKETALFFAFCMSKWDSPFVSLVVGKDFNQTEAFGYLAEALSMKSNTLKNYRDAFDPHIEQTRSNRRGWQVPITDELSDIVSRYNNLPEQECVELARQFLQKSE